MKAERKMISCACGCNTYFLCVDKKGRLRRFIHGHNKGNTKPHTEEAKDKMRMAAFGKKYTNEINKKKGVHCIGEGNHNWRGGVTSENDKIRKTIQYKEWRKGVFDRDNYTCQGCGRKEDVSGKLNAHHIKQFSKFPNLRFELTNGITLCKPCHEKTDTYLTKGRWKNHKAK